VSNLLGHLSLGSIPWAQGWAALGALVPIAALVWEIRRARPEKLLTSRVTVTPIPNATLVRWTLANTGTHAIEKDDYDRPLALVFGEGSQPLGVEVEREHRGGLQPSVIPGRNRLVFVPQLLNAGDGFTVTAVVRSYSGPPRLEGRVINVPEIIDADEAARRKARVSRRVGALGAVALAAVVILIALVAPEGSRSGGARDELDLAVRSWGVVGAPYRGQYEIVLGVNAYANNSATAVDIRLARFRLLVSSFDAANWAPPGAQLAAGATQLDFGGRRVWAVPPTANGVSVLNPATGIRTVPSLWRGRMLERGASYPARAPDGVMTFFLPRRDVLNNGVLSRVIGLAYVSPAGKVLRLSSPRSWGPRRAATEV
jgi:hypothetical protein